MGFHVQVLEVGTAGEIDGQSGEVAGLTTALGQDVGDGADSRGVPVERFLHRATEFLGAIVVEQKQELLGHGRHGLAALEAGIEEGFGGRDGADEAPTGGRAAGPLLLG